MSTTSLIEKIDKMNRMKTISLDQWIPAETVAALFNIKKENLMEGIREMRYPFTYSKPSGNRVLILKSDVEKYIEAQSTLITNQ